MSLAPNAASCPANFGSLKAGQSVSFFGEAVHLNMVLPS